MPIPNNIKRANINEVINQINHGRQFVQLKL